MNILSLFDGISAVQQAFQNMQIPVVYHSCEIDKNCIKATLNNYPNTIQLGDVRGVLSESLPSIHLLVGGSPCQNLSRAGTRSGLQGDSSKLFYEYVRLLEQVKPTYFLFENVASMSKSSKQIITEYLGVPPVEINSILFLPQQRRRLYWTNIPIDLSRLPNSPTNSLQTLLESSVEDKYHRTQKTIDYSFALRAHNMRPSCVEHQAKTLMCGYHANATTDNLILTTHTPSGLTPIRRLTPVEYERLQGFPDGYTSGLADTNRYKALGNSFTIPVIEWIISYMPSPV